jgi:hypothetical protein
MLIDPLNQCLLASLSTFDDTKMGGHKGALQKLECQTGASRYEAWQN